MRNFFFLFLIPLLLPLTIFAENNGFLSLPHRLADLRFSPVLWGEYHKTNDQLDFLNVREQELGKTALDKFGTIGDLDGYALGGSYPFLSRLVFFGELRGWAVDYSGETLANRSVNAMLRVHPFSYSEGWDLFFDAGYGENRAQALDIRNEEMINGMIRKIKPGTSLRLDDGTLDFGDSTVTLFDTEGEKIHPFIRIDELGNDDLYLRLALVKRFSRAEAVLFGEAHKKRITGALDVEPSDVSIVRELLADYRVPAYDRDEESRVIGLKATLDLFAFRFAATYRHVRILRSSELSDESANRILDAYIGYRFDSGITVYFGGTAMSNQFNSHLPYLYNAYSQSIFDKKYGYAAFGLTYRFQGGGGE